MNKKLEKIRSSYTKSSLDEKILPPNPWLVFSKWFAQLLKTDVVEPTAMTLATASIDAKPSARTVLLKKYDPKSGFVFYTNYESRKGVELNANPSASLLFYWPQLERQVRIEGKVKKVSRAQSLAYFQSRPRGSQLGAWVSEQSKALPNRQYIEEVYKKLELYFKDNKNLPLPPFWGGYTLIPDYFEFWQGRPDRLHDRIIYRKAKRGWIKQRLAP